MFYSMIVLSSLSRLSAARHRVGIARRRIAASIFNRWRNTAALQWKEMMMLPASWFVGCATMMVNLVNEEDDELQSKSEEVLVRIDV
jgi:hypothetical protein